MGGDNGVSITLVIFAGSVATGGLIIQESNDLENWGIKSTLPAATANVGATVIPAAASAVSSAYIRVKVTGSSGTVLSLSLNTAKL